MWRITSWDSWSFTMVGRKPWPAKASGVTVQRPVTESPPKNPCQGQQRAFSSPVSLFPVPRHGSGRHGITVSSRTYVALADDRPRLFTLCYASMVSLNALFTVWGYRHQTMLTLPWKLPGSIHDSSDCGICIVRHRFPPPFHHV